MNIVVFTRRLLCSASLLALAGGAVSADLARAPARFTWVDLGTLGGSYATPADINNQRQVVGTSTRNDQPECLGVDQEQPCEYAFIWEHGRMVDLGQASPGGVRTVPTRINAHGLVVGYEDVPVSGDGSQLLIVYKPFVFSQGQFRALPLLASGANASGLAYGLNTAGVATGFSEETNQDQTLVNWSADGVARGVTDAGIYRRGLGINDSGVVAGWQYRPRSFTPTNGFVQDQGVVTNLSASDVNIWSEALDVNREGLVVGDRADRAFSAGLATAWRQEKGAWVARRIGALPGHNHSSLLRVNAHGVAVGFSEDAALLGSQRAIAVLGGRIVDLNTRVSLPPHVTLTKATAINDLGDIVGEASVRDGPPHAFLLTRR